MPVFQPIINYPPTADSLKAGADKINANLAYTQNKGSGVLTIPDSPAEQVLIQAPTLPELFLVNTTPSDSPLARKMVFACRGYKASTSLIEQLRLEVLLSDQPGADADSSEARLFMTLDNLGLVEALKIYQSPQFSTTGQAQFIFNPRSYLTDDVATVAILGTLPSVPAKLKLATVETGGAQGDGINFEIQGDEITLRFGTGGPLNIPRFGNGSGQLYFKPTGAFDGDFVGINTYNPLNTFSVFKTASPSASLQAFYWDVNGPHTATYDCRAIDGTLGAMGWQQIDYPATKLKSRWFATASTGVAVPDVKLELEAGNVYFSAPGIVREGLRNEERLSKVTYINELTDFPGYPGPITFTAGIWDANEIPFTITQNMTLLAGATVRNLNITTDQKIICGDAASSLQKTILENSKITYTGFNIDGLFRSGSAGLSQTTIFVLRNCELVGTLGGRLFGIESNLTVYDFSVSISDCSIKNLALGSFEGIRNLQARNLRLHQIKSGFFWRLTPKATFESIYVEDQLADNVILFMTDRRSSDFLGGEKLQSTIAGVTMDGASSTKAFWIATALPSDDEVRVLISRCNFYGVSTPFLTSPAPLFFSGNTTGLTGEMVEGQTITGSVSGATGVIISMRSEVGSFLRMNVLKTSVADFSGSELMTTATGSMTMTVSAGDIGYDQTDKKIKTSSNIGIVPSLAMIQSGSAVTPVVTSMPTGQIRRVNATYSVQQSERFTGTTSGNLVYAGIERTTGNVSYEIAGYIASGIKTGLFYVGRGNTQNTITGTASGGAGLTIVGTSQAHGYAPLDVVLIEGTTSYNGSYSIVAVLAPDLFVISKTFVGSETGLHARVDTSSVFLFYLSATAVSKTFSRTISRLSVNEYMFLCGEILTGGNLTTQHVRAVYTGSC